MSAPAPPARPLRAGEGWLSPWPPLNPLVYLRRPVAPQFPLDRPDRREYAYARQGLWHGLHALGIAAGDEVLVPAYHHGSEVEVLVRAGIEPRFYGYTEALEPDAGALAALVGPRTRALYLIHHLGFGQDVRRWRAWCDERGLLLLEDAAMAWPAARDGVPLGSLGDLAIFSPWKLWGLADSGVLLCRTPPGPSPRPLRRIPLGNLHAHAKWLTRRSHFAVRVRAPVAKAAADAQLTGPEYDLGDPDAAPSRASRAYLRRADAAAAAARRREHHATMLAAFGELVPAPYDRPRGEECPFVMPIVVDGRDAVIQRLEGWGVRALHLWARPHAALAEPDRFPLAAELRRRVVGLPVHQELSDRDVERIVEAVHGCLG